MRIIIMFLKKKNFQAELSSDVAQLQYWAKKVEYAYMYIHIFEFL